MGQVQMEHIVERVQKLPTLPAVANRITNLLNDPDCTAVKIAEIISTDQSLTARVLRLVNSAYYSLSAEVGNVRHAVALLGFRTISQMVISIAVFDVFKEKYGTEFDRSGFWKHSIGCGVLSKMIAQRARYPREDECFTAGLLHDIGKVVLDQYVHDEMILVLKVVREQGLSFVDAEQEVMGLNHAHIGGQVMKKWNIPLAILAAVQHHHQPVHDRKGSAFSQDLIVDCVQLADALCKHGHIGFSGDAVMPVLEEPLWERLQLNRNTIDVLMTESSAEIEKAYVLLELT